MSPMCQSCHLVEAELIWTVSVPETGPGRSDSSNCGGTNREGGAYFRFRTACGRQWNIAARRVAECCVPNPSELSRKERRWSEAARCVKSLSSFLGGVSESASWQESGATRQRRFRIAVCPCAIRFPRRHDTH